MVAVNKITVTFVQSALAAGFAVVVARLNALLIWRAPAMAIISRNPVFSGFRQGAKS
jgi:hypothetical protein